MISTTILAFIVIQEHWKWSKFTSFGFLSLFLTIDILFFASNSLKIPDGGWLPVTIGIILFFILTTWIKGKALLSKCIDEKRVTFEDIGIKIAKDNPVVVKGSAIYLARIVHGMPQVFLQNLEHNHVLHEQVIIMTVVIKDEPYVDYAHRIKIRTFGENHNFHRVKLFYGFQQTPNVKQAVARCIDEGLIIDYEKTSFFIGSEHISFKKKSPLANWRRPLFRFLFNNASSAIEFFKIPVERVVELGLRIEI